MNNQDVISKIAEEVKLKLSGEGSGHDWWHVYRVWKNAQNINQKEGGDSFCVELAALLHDIADWKFHDGDDTVGPRVAGEMLRAHKVDDVIIARVQNIISEVSFKGAGVKTVPSSKEGMIVQDADRLDAMGAIGVARAFAYGGHKNRLFHDPAIQPILHATKEEYSKNVGTTINHFYEKLLLLKDLLNTQAAKEIGDSRHQFMQNYLEQFLGEWEGDR